MKRNYPSVLFWAVIVACFVCDSVSGICNIFFGTGRVACVKLSGYSGYQIAACRSKSYVERKSKGRHSCGPFGIHSACYYQCMLDLYGNGGGEIYKKCRCDPTKSGSPAYPSSGGITRSSREPITPFTVPSSCYTPDPNTCTWYKQCFNRAFPSCDNDNEKTIKFLTEFCSFNQQKPNVLSTRGNQWLEATVKCVKRKLTPLLATNQQVKNCEDIRTTVMERYSQCYREPNSTFCDLGEDDRLGLFWHLRYNSSYHNTYEKGLKSVLDLMRECRDTVKDDALVQTVKEKLDKKEREANISSGAPRDLQIAELRIKAWLENPPVSPIQVDMVLTKNSWWWVRGSSLNEQSSFAAEIVDKLASKQKWKDENVIWFAYAVKKGEDLNIRLLLDDRYRLDSTSSVRADLGAILMKLSHAVLKRNLNVKVATHRNVEIIKLTGCLNSNCQDISYELPVFVTPPPTNPEPPTNPTQRKKANCFTKNGRVIFCNAADTPRSLNTLTIVYILIFVINFLL
ncbi:uncharacterized protein LOC114520456 isoform X1 [Dendronephthya gigantea]|uniref:uncharacterized protein LOC114520456 isoform X1 n=1 Tax=Dendronephthya gigantea TaxID=151771 RepID=UPI00106A3556|nr:uncharacterized protein LOC114520456 isoform X1 [Dendronephthya gigantea]XP_028396522.1 uncharacterized protein LOC114520456 isoform X1 [Dendronephthya gigantea]